MSNQELLTEPRPEPIKIKNQVVENCECADSPNVEVVTFGEHAYAVHETMVNNVPKVMFIRQ